MSYTLTLTCSVDKNISKDLDLKCMHTLCTLFLGVCTPCADFFWVLADLFQTSKIPPFSPSCTGSFRIPVCLIGLITAPTSLDRNSQILFSVVLKGLKSLHSLHGVHKVCMGLPPNETRTSQFKAAQGAQGAAGNARGQGSA